MKTRERILTGDRTTGKLHLGHLAGSLMNRVRLQHDYETFILLADVQALTTHFENPSLIYDSILQVALDNLSVGLDPQLVTFVQQSQVPAIAELTVYYSMIVTVNTLRHNPTVKSEAAQYGFHDLSYGFLGYPVSQAADITFLDADLVPVGEDQLPHMELCRKIARRFCDLYGGGEPVLTVPQPLLSPAPRLPGLDGKSKMGKSLGNALYLTDGQETVEAKVHSAVTDTNRISATDKGNPEVCTVSAYHNAFHAKERENISELCRKGQIGCVACKKELSKHLNTLLEPVRERRRYYKEHMEQVKAMINEGSRRANEIGALTSFRVREAMKLIV